ncbi:aminomethyl-transferring glycine dehydrogenase subunit GcvPA [Caldalkalibacillus mannanilyticus]|uniref:aminomethyl-transferring glycine dehydrogenase subunit GcvPA n=1 Tax=Caldalkalibacillus mannanilyticus TaxID=1418 RepID=UPI00046AE198|nr:aminomethyl-transferring glycine dehydrogenase subunit GcvPA [Caldalkalibacillus mannanilyticus]
MKFRYLPMTDVDQQEMMKEIGINSIDELFSDIPDKVRFKGEFQVSKALNETELTRYLMGLAAKNAHSLEYSSFLGAGTYEHYIPSVVNHVISRSEFYTAYTPYQPEISQGELQAMFEFQTMICELTGMDVANSSMYDGLTSLVEAAAMASGLGKQKKIVISKSVHPEARSILHTSSKGLGIEIVEVEVENGVTNLTQLEAAIDGETAAVIVQYPNFFGNLEDLARIEQLTHAQKGIFIVKSNPLALGALQPPGAYGADVVVGDAQPFGIPTAFGGPHCGYFAVNQKLMRKIPGRLVGQTVDDNGKRGFVLTLQAREQHIRREKATSNICSNQALNAIAASVAMTALGKNGVQEAAMLNIQKAHYAKERLSQVKGVEVVFNQPFFNEFVIKLSKPVKEVNQALLSQGIIGGFDLSQDYSELENHMLVAVTEVKTKEEIDRFAQVLEGIL